MNLCVLRVFVVRFINHKGTKFTKNAQGGKRHFHAALSAHIGLFRHETHFLAERITAIPHER